MLSVWCQNRAERFLVGWVTGMALLAGGVIMYSTLPPKWAITTTIAFSLEISGFVAVLAGARLFTGRPAPIRHMLLLGLLVLLPVAIPISMGLDGLGIMNYNFLGAIFLALTAGHYWAVRDEAFIPITALTILYTMAALSFLACGIMLLKDRTWVLSGRPENWAEQFNALVSIVGITGIGALSLGLNHARAARKHRLEARTDALTGLMNRRALFDGMTGDKIDWRYAVIVFDLDHFKSINDRYGHSIGDEVLRRFAMVLKTNSRKCDLAARTGGEEFVLVMPNTSPRVATNTAERIRTIFAEAYTESDDGPFHSTASAGIASGISPAETFEQILHRADASLYAAKESGRNRVIAAFQAVA